ncbi:T9SS type A sorting domain-containing protein [bacterium]|nr:T9SS type A sorting domain-containing protein [bacterium]
MKKPSLLTILTFLFIIFSNAQTFDWVKSVKNISHSSFVSYESKYDQFGNVYNIGFYQDSIQFASLQGQSKTLYGDGIYLLKTDSNGIMSWANSLNFNIFDFTIDPLGYIYIFAAYWDTVDVDPGANVFLLPPDTSIQSFRSNVILKINPNGDLAWAKNLSGYFVVNGKITADTFGNIFLATNFEVYLDIDPNPLISYNLYHPNKLAVFKWDTNGNLIWGKGFGEDVELSNLAVKKNRLLINGLYSGTVDFDPDPLKSFSKTAAANSDDPFALALDTSGNFKWVVDYRRTNVEGFGSIAIDEKMDVYFTSTYSGSNDFDPSPNQSILTSAYPREQFILKIDANGKFKWVKQIAGLKNYNQNSQIKNKIGPSGDLYVVGVLKGHSDFDPGAGVQSINTGNQYALYTLRLNESGVFKSLISLSSTYSFDLGGFDVGIKNNLIYSGTFVDTVDFDPSPAVYNVVSQSSFLSLRNIFLLQYNQCFETYGNLQANDCHFYQSPFSSKLWQTSGIYTDTTSNYMGCDSVVSINVQLSNINNTMGLLGSSLASNDFGATYQWLNCDSNYSVIANEIGQLFTPNKNGNYAVELTKNNCKDTSACFSYTLVSQKELSLAHSVLVSPNPSKGLYNVVASSGYDRLIITDLSGRIVYSNSSSLSGAVQIDLSNYENGIYLLTIENKGERVVKKLVKH